MAPSPIGLQHLTELVLERVHAYLAQDARPEAWVVGVFGEWGSGKSTLLQEIANHFPNTPLTKPAPKAVVTLRVEFNAWRYEREEHLLVPLLRTIERTLDEYADAIDALPVVEPAAPEPVAPGTEPVLNIPGVSHADAADALAKTIAARPEKKRERRHELARWIGNKAKLAGLCAIAMTKAVKFKAEVPFVGGFELAPAEGAKAVRDVLSDARVPSAADARDTEPALDAQSFYYNLFTHLRQLTTPSEHRLNLVFLIDDLDRCLPEKAVEMLESIKLFLDVRGCVFVLAVDDEVVERGIAHRYRDYLDVTDRAAESIAHSLHPEHYRAYLGRYATSRQAPITGSEYLEKIIHLAVRLPRFSRKQATDLLRQLAPDLFMTSSPAPGEPASGWMLDLFLDAVPPVPRKLIRAADLLLFVRQLAERQGVLTQLHGYTLAQLTLLQVFAPQMFRYLARRDRLASWTRLGARLEAAQRDAGSDIYGASFFDWWERSVEKARKAILDKDPDAPKDVSLTELERYEEPFIAELRQACTGRSGFDPRKLFLPNMTVDRNLRPYINLLIEESATSATAPPVIVTPPVTAAPVAPAPVTAAPAALSPARPAAPPPPPTPTPTPARAPEPDTATAAPRELGNFVDLLLSAHEDSWHGALDSEPSLQGRVLDRRSFLVLRERIDEQRFEITGRWLGIVGAVLSDVQVKELLSTNTAMARATSDNVLDTLAAGELIETACRKLRPWDGPLTTLDPAHIGLPDGVELNRREWAYRYRRGLIDPAVTKEEPIQIWRGYPSLLSSPVHAVCEVKPGLLAVSTTDGHVRLWSSSFRGQWMVAGQMAAATMEGFRLKPLSPVHVVGFSDSAVAVWHLQSFGTWVRIFAWPHGRDLREAVVLSPTRFVVLSSNGLLTAFHSPTRGHWTPLPVSPAAAPVKGIARLSDDQLVTLAPICLLYSFTDKGLAQHSNVSWDDPPVSIISTGQDRLFVTFGGGHVRLVRIDDGGQGTTLASKKSSLTLGQFVESNGNLVLLRNDESFEVWARSSTSLQRLGEGAAGSAQSPYPVGLLHDGRVACGGLSSGLAVLKPTPSGSIYDFDGPVVGSIGWEPSVAIVKERAVLTHPGGAVLLETGTEEGERRVQVTKVQRPERGGYYGACAVGPDEFLLIDANRDAVIWNVAANSAVRVTLGLTTTAPLRLEPSPEGAGAHVSAGDTIVRVFPDTGGWATQRRTGFLGNVDGMVVALDGTVLAWQGMTGAVLAPESLSFAKTLQLPHELSSAVRLPKRWRERSESTVLLCAHGEVYIIDLGTGVVEPWVTSTERIVAAAGFGDNGTLGFTSDGSILVFDGQRPRHISTQVLHGLPTRVGKVDRHVAIVYAPDDAWYRIEVSESWELNITRFLMTFEGLVVQHLTERDSLPVRATPRVSELIPLDPMLRYPEVIMPRRIVSEFLEHVDAVPLGDVTKNLAALLRKNGELAEPSARPDTISWRRSPVTSQAVALTLRRP